MPDFNVRSDSVNVEQIMEQIRARIREKRGVDYTEQQIRELAAVKLEKFLDPRGVRSDLLEQFRKAQPAYEPPELPNYAFEDDTLFESHRGAAAVHPQAAAADPEAVLQSEPAHPGAEHPVAAEHDVRRAGGAARSGPPRVRSAVTTKLMHNLVLETTRIGIEVKNLKMRVESLSSRLEFNERRARALESVVVYKPADERAPGRRPSPPAAAASRAALRRRRRNRRRRRRSRRSRQAASAGRARSAQPATSAPARTAWRRTGRRA